LSAEQRENLSVARGKNLARAADLGPDAVADLADEQAIDAGLAAAAPGGYDVIVDFLSEAELAALDAMLPAGAITGDRYPPALQEISAR
jgi:NADPH:quinone reductase-like Zn-dependent oxidoreductase